jgi:hypothetical protein
MTAATYRKKPVEIQAIRVREALLSARDDWYALPSWLIDAYEHGKVVFLNDHLTIKTLEGTMTAQADDMLIQGVQGELYPCKPDIFDATYEAVE